MSLYMYFGIFNYRKNMNIFERTIKKIYIYKLTFLDVNVISKLKWKS